ncbi:MAG: LemA family protein [Phycisphaerae bacterium]|nr:LemA family protein [Phycisphaerae bacterium]
MWPAVIIAVIVLLIPAIMYNSLIAKRNQVRNIFATTDALLKKRFDLIPNLVATVKGYADHERKLLEDVTKARANRGWNQISDDEKVALDNAFSNAVGRVMMVAEKYPDLKAGENFLHLQRTLNELEEQISAARRAYNASVTDYNNAVEMFPTNIIASIGSFQRKNFFEIPDTERRNPAVGPALNG